MSALQAFYDRVFHPSAALPAPLARLARLAEASLADLRLLKSELDWGQWEGLPAAS